MLRDSHSECGTRIAIHSPMPHSPALLVALILVAMSAVRCANDPLAPTSPSLGNDAASVVAGRIAGTWGLASIQPAGEAERSVPSGAPYTLTIAGDRISTKADCNVCSGNLVASGQNLAIGPLLACTRAACATREFENMYVGILRGRQCRADRRAVAHADFAARRPPLPPLTSVSPANPRSRSYVVAAPPSLTLANESVS